MGGAVIPALVLSTLAGLSTAIGGLIALFTKRSDETFLSFSLGFAAGVMLLVSFDELLPDARASLTPAMGVRFAGVGAAGSLLMGMLVALLINRLVPDEKAAGTGPGPAGGASLARVGIVTAVAITVHNLPEGIATFMAGYANIRLGLPVAISIALHNIPEGISVAVPVYFGTGSRIKAFGYSALSGLSEPLGALLAYLVLAPFLNGVTLGVIFGAVAGVMIYISFDGLIPSAQEYGHTKAAILGVFLGVLLMKVIMELFHL